jgi:hypothetical protein
MTLHRPLFSLLARLLPLAVLLPALAACDRGGRLAQLTPQPTVSTPVVLGVTAEVVEATGGTPAPPTTAAPAPTATYDPARLAWTILYYASADSDQASFVWDDLNEMEAGAASEQVRVVAQVDWPEGGPANTAESVRYVIRPDADPTQLASETVTTLGESNQGDPATLADFLAWGVATYPANRTVLVLGGFGGGWAGCCLDAAAGDHLSLTELDQALALAQSQTGARLEIIAFTAGLMGQLDVLQTVQPYAAYAVASPDLVPGASWDFQAVLAQLEADPFIDGRQLAGDLVTALVNTQRQLEGNEFAVMAAVDLARVPALSAAVESLAAAVAGDPILYAEVAGFARRGAQTYGGAVLTDALGIADAERIAAVDLSHAAALVAEVSPPGEAQAAATTILTALTDALVAFDHGQGLSAGRGVAIYWPATAAALDPLYATAGRLPSWAAFLAQFVAGGGNAARLTLDGGPREVVHIAQPALMRATLAAYRLRGVALVAEQTAADGRRVLRQYNPVRPTTQTLPGGTNAALWADGWHESLIVWDATGSYLSDAAGAGDFVPLRAVDASPIGSQLGAAGRFRRAAGEDTSEATVIFGPNAPVASRLWLTAVTGSGARLFGEARPAPGDVFQPAVIFVAADGTQTTEPGVALTYDDTPTLYRSARPLPAGQYEVGLRATALDGPPLSATRPLTIDPALAPAGFRAYVDAANGAQFLYPVDWLPPMTQEGVTFTANISGTAQLQARAYPGWTGDLAALQSEALGTFGQVSVLQQGPVGIGPEPATEGIRTAYGYDSAEQGARTGVFLTFLKDGVGFVVDLDGPREAEAASVATIDTIAATWQFLPPRLGFGPEPWSMLNVGEFRLRYPAGYAYQAYNSWHRFAADPQTFVATRIQPAARTPAEAMAGLLQTAAEGVTGFTADEPRRFFYAGHVWERNDFTYTDGNGRLVTGLLLSRQDGETEIAVWAETPDATGDLPASVFLPTAASIERIVAAPSG